MHIIPVYYIFANTFPQGVAHILNIFVMSFLLKRSSSHKYHWIIPTFLGMDCMFYISYKKWCNDHSCNNIFLFPECFHFLCYILS